MKSLTILLVVSMFLGTIIIQMSFFPMTNAQINSVFVTLLDDTWTDTSSPDSNFGSQENLNISRYNASTIYEKTVWLKFNLSEVPDGAVVTSSMLQLYCTFVDQPLNVSAHFCDNNTWSEQTVTFNNQPSFNMTAMPSLCQSCGPESWAIVDNAQAWYLFDVTYAVNRTIDGIHGGEDVVSTVLRNDWIHGSASEAAFYSKEGKYAYLPKLRVVWSHVVPEFPSLTILSLLMIASLLATAYRIKRAKPDQF